jgi:O-antigen/teichoic acid export membrane protein
MVKWIPGEAVALYVAGITATNADRVRERIWLLVVMWAVAVLLVPLSAYLGSTPSKLTEKGPIIVTAVTTALAGVAFGVWSLTIPGGAWQRWDAVANSPSTVAWGGGAVAVLFGLLAEPLVDKLKAKYKIT